jgi:hypothetical protein
VQEQGRTRLLPEQTAVAPVLSILPRPLTELERAVLDHLLSAEFAGVEALREQVEHVQVERDAEGSPTIDLVVRNEVAPRANVVDRVPVEAWSKLPYDSDDFIQVLLFVDGGLLTSLELVWYKHLPEEFPPPSELRPLRPFSGDYQGE